MSQTCKSGHSTLTPGCKDCEELKAYWDKALEASGLEDIEKENVFYSDSRSGLKRATANIADSEAVQSYYSTAAAYLHHGEFKDEMERRCWELHADGAPMRRIAAEVGLSVRAIWKRVNRVKTRAFKT